MDSGYVVPTFVLFLPVAVVLALVSHELGHAALGRLSGYRVVACGLGVRQPFLVVRLGGTCFYLARPLTMGLTVGVRERLDAPRAAMPTFIAGGVTANFAVAAVTWALSSRGVGGGPVDALFWASLVLGALNALPFAIRRGKFVLSSDGRQMWMHLRGLGGAERTLAQTVGLSRVVRDLMCALESPDGAAFYTVWLAFFEIAVQNVEAAKAALEHPCLGDAARGGFARAAELLVRAHLAAVIEESKGDTGRAVPDAIDRALDACGDDRVSITLLLLLRARRALDRGEGATAAAQAALDSAHATRRSEFVLLAEAVALEAEPPDDAATASRPVFDGLARRMSAGPDAAWLAASLARRLAERGDAAAAGPLFREATRLGAAAATTLPVEGRARFLERLAVPLRAAVTAAGGAELPLYLDEAPQPTAARRIRPGFVLGLVGAFVAVVLALVRVLQPENSPRQRHDMGVYAVAQLEERVRALEALRAGDTKPASALIDADASMYDAMLARVTEGQPLVAGAASTRARLRSLHAKGHGGAAPGSTPGAPVPAFRTPDRDANP